MADGRQHHLYAEEDASGGTSERTTRISPRPGRPTCGSKWDSLLGLTDRRLLQHVRYDPRWQGGTPIVGGGECRIHEVEVGAPQTPVSLMGAIVHFWLLRGYEMISLEWRRQGDMAWLPPGAPLSFGKTVVLRGVGYSLPAPAEFVLYRVPSKLISWVLERQHKAAKWEFARRPARLTSTAPFIAVDSDNVVLAPGGFFSTHRWQFTDQLDNWSPVVRTTRFGSVKSSLNASHAGVGATLETIVATTIDPTLRIDLSLPWDEGSAYPSPRAAILSEIEDLRSIGAEVPAADEFIQSLEQFFPTERPSGLDISWSTQEVSLVEGETRTFEARASSVSTQPFAFCFVATDTETGDVATSEVAVIWRDETGATSAFGLEG